MIVHGFGQYSSGFAPVGPAGHSRRRVSTFSYEFVHILPSPFDLNRLFINYLLG
jgi:hypothetical protein